jgi:hypothetical protein
MVAGMQEWSFSSLLSACPCLSTNSDIASAGGIPVVDGTARGGLRSADDTVCRQKQPITSYSLKTVQPSLPRVVT